VAVTPPPSEHRRLSRAALTAATVVIALAAVIGLVSFLNGRDSSGVSSTPSGSGQAFANQGAQHLRPGQRPSAPYNSSPPTSGAHVPSPVTRDDARVTDDQLLSALEAGNVVLAYGTPTAPPGLQALATDVAGAPFDPSLARAGQAVILARRPGTPGVVAVAWRHLLRAASPRDPGLKAFVDDWLGVGARGK
jgi:hypothetical protein